ncbi:MAG: DUF167 domain-containing protein [Phycisphaerales bacterium]|nr:DUF167 domain-containing protein [Phycisphaerales bacterium]
MPIDANAIQLISRSGGVEFGVKVVPGASRDAIVGVLGDALKIAVSAPPEGGKANAAVTRALARALGVKDACVTIVAGTTQARKRVQVVGLTEAEFRQRVGDPNGKNAAT